MSKSCLTFDNLIKELQNEANGFSINKTYELYSQMKYAFKLINFKGTSLESLVKYKLTVENDHIVGTVYLDVSQMSSSDLILLKFILYDFKTNICNRIIENHTEKGNNMFKLTIS